MIYTQLIELYRIYNANLLYTHLFFSTFYVKSYHTSAIHSYQTFEPTRYRSRQLSSMSNRITLSLITSPVEIIYRILDHQSDRTIICSMRNVCQRLNTIVDSYDQYQVNFFFYFKCLIFIHFQNIIHFHSI